MKNILAIYGMQGHYDKVKPILLDKGVITGFKSRLHSNFNPCKNLNPVPILVFDPINIPKIVKRSEKKIDFIFSCFKIHMVCKANGLKVLFKGSFDYGLHGGFGVQGKITVNMKIVH